MWTVFRRRKWWASVEYQDSYVEHGPFTSQAEAEQFVENRAE